MNKSKIGGGVLGLCLIILLLSIYGCKKPVSLQSKWLDKKIEIDADDIDWKDYPFFYDEKTRSCIGLYNDDKNLYLCFMTMDEEVQESILHQGLYIWFNKTGGKDKELGLCFPEGGGFGGPGGPGGPGGQGGQGGPPDMSGGMQGPPPDMSSDMSDPPEDGSEDSTKRPKRPFPQASNPEARLRIFTSEDDEGYSCNINKAARLGIEVKYTVDQRKRFIYELKMPIVETEKTAFVAKASELNQIGMGFMTAKMKKGGPSGGMGGGPGGGPGGGSGGGMGGGMPGGGSGGGMSGGGMGGGMGGGPGGGMGGGPGGGMGSKGKSMEIWTIVTLASGPVNNQ